MKDLLEALERAERALNELVDMDEGSAALINDAYVAQGKMARHIRDLTKELGEEEVKKLQDWNKSFEYRHRPQEARIP